ncbi:hypothetical protein C5612_19650 [Pseudomonas frederiksbergensis]|uniref:Uncharacterized protein n=1 Tax=Pseudomonas frederiksbergensis TaxID=104087 RepID=A0A2S8HGC6_9PSED|nr:hypothetical protein C5612_19650 [Pseudomonas frederiksbergensis]
MKCRSLCSSCRACEAAFDGAAVVNPADAVCLTHRDFWFDDCCAAERSLAGARQLLQRNQPLRFGSLITTKGKPSCVAAHFYLPRCYYSPANGPPPAIASASALPGLTTTS